MGANIDILRVSEDYMADFLGAHFEFNDPTGLASSFIHQFGQNGEINSVDIYLNTNFDWATDGTDYDVETVVLHEIGHALGLDHPDQAAPFGAENCSSYTYDAGHPVSGSEVLDSRYASVKRDLTDDKIGGLLFIYIDEGDVTKGDLTLDGLVTFNDFQPFQRLRAMSGQESLMDMARGDFNGDGQITLNPDLQGFLNALTGRGGSAPFSVVAPEPGSLVCLLIGGLFLGARPRRNS